MGRARAAQWSRTRRDLLSLREPSPVSRRCRRAEPRPAVAELFNTPSRLAWPSTRTTCPARGAELAAVAAQPGPRQLRFDHDDIHDAAAMTADRVEHGPGGAAGRVQSDDR